MEHTEKIFLKRHFSNAFENVSNSHAKFKLDKNHLRVPVGGDEADRLEHRQHCHDMYLTTSQMQVTNGSQSELCIKEEPIDYIIGMKEELDVSDTKLQTNVKSRPMHALPDTKFKILDDKLGNFKSVSEDGESQDDFTNLKLKEAELLNSEYVCNVSTLKGQYNCIRQSTNTNDIGPPLTVKQEPPMVTVKMEPAKESPGCSNVRPGYQRPPSNFHSSNYEGVRMFRQCTSASYPQLERYNSDQPKQYPWLPCPQTPSMSISHSTRPLNNSTNSDLVNTFKSDFLQTCFPASVLERDSELSHQGSGPMVETDIVSGPMVETDIASGPMVETDIASGPIVESDIASGPNVETDIVLSRKSNIHQYQTAFINFIENSSVSVVERNNAHNNHWTKQIYSRNAFIDRVPMQKEPKCLINRFWEGEPRGIFKFLPSSMPLSIADTHLLIEKALCEELGEVTLPSIVDTVYNPLEYAFETHYKFAQRFCNSERKVMFLGMNPGPWGMSQNGIPFGEVNAVRQWLQIEGHVDRPRHQLPVREVKGLDCTRSEISGKRFWGIFKDLCGTPDNFFTNCLVYNMSPLAFMNSKGKNITPPQIEVDIRRQMNTICDKALLKMIIIYNIQVIVGVGRFAHDRAHTVLSDAGLSGVRVELMLHPSPANPAAHHNWDKKVLKQLKDCNVLDIVQNKQFT